MFTVRNSTRNTTILICCLLVTSNLASLSVAEENLTDVFDSKFQEELLNKMELGRIPSLSIGVIRGTELVWEADFGTGEGKDPVYMIGSITKTFTAISILQLVEQGLISLSDDVDDFLPFSIRDPKYPSMKVTFEMLLSHTSGLAADTLHYYRWMLFDLYKKMGASNETVSSIEELLIRFFTPSADLYIANTWSGYRPGFVPSLIEYSNMGFSLVSYLVERITGLPFDQYVQTNIMDPLGLIDTLFNSTAYQNDRITVPHERDFPANPSSFPNQEVLPVYNLLPEGAGSLWSNVDDLSKLLITIIKQGVFEDTTILTPASIGDMETPRGSYKRFEGWTQNYGLGMYSRDFPNSDHGLVFQGHEGHVFGYRVYMGYNTSSQGTLGIIVLTNQGDKYGTSEESNSFDAILEIIIDKAKGLEDPFVSSSAESSQTGNGFLGPFSIILSSLVAIFFVKRSKRSFGEYAKAKKSW